MNNVISFNGYLIIVESSAGTIDKITVFNCSNAFISMENVKIILKNSIFKKTLEYNWFTFTKESCLKFQYYTIEMESYLENVVFSELISTNNGSVINF